MNRNKSPRIVFMGTPEFAVASLNKLVREGFDIVAVVTAADKPSGRGMKLRMSDVKKAALHLNIPVLQPKNLKSEDFNQQLQALHPDLQLVVAFRMLPEIVWALPPMGTINLHASLLPQYRGAAPINHAIINGERETGVTTFMLQHAIDTGNILLQKKVQIADEDTAGTLHDKLMAAGADLLADTVRGLTEGSIRETEQAQLAPEETLQPAPKIFRDDCEIKWDQNTADIHNFIRGMTPYPGAYSYLNDKRIIISKSAVELAEIPGIAGEYTTDGKHFLKIKTADGYLSILRLKPEGKREMSIEDFLRGHRNL